MFDWLLNLILPPHCPLCGKKLLENVARPFCQSCADKIPEVQGDCCPTCGRPFPSQELLEVDPGFRCGTCRLCAPKIDGAKALLYFEGAARDALHLFKYKGYWKLGRALIRQVDSRIREVPWEVDLVLPVPLASGRLRLRGFNQAGVLAREISVIRNVPLTVNLLVRKRAGRPQVGLKGTRRLRNIRGAFAVTDGGRVIGRKILLVDDVLTTGATANECGRVLKEAGAASVHLIALAGAYQPPDAVGVAGVRCRPRDSLSQDRIF